MSYLMIENKGEAPVAALLLFGATTKDSSRDESTIGMFGSGSKHAILTCLRKGLHPVIYSGKNKLEFVLKEISIGDASHKEVLVSLNGKTPQSTGSTLMHGQQDWKDDIRLALREFVSNALDAANGDPSQIRILQSELRASSGFTRVFIPWPEGSLGKATYQEFLENWFLHFRVGFSPSVEGVIRKVKPHTPARFYRRGVNIRQSNRSAMSLWDYNFTKLSLDEARNSDEWAMSHAAGKLISKDPAVYAKTLRAIAQDQSIWESGLSQYYLADSGASNKEAIQAAMIAEFGEDAVFVTTNEQAELTQSKGLRPVIVPASWQNSVHGIGAKSYDRALTEDQRCGREILEPTQEMRDLVQKWEAQIIRCNLATTKAEAPKILAFREPPKDKILFGFARPEGIFLNIEVSGELLEQTVIEELAHYYSGQGDFSRGFQEWLIRLVMKGVNQNDK